MRKEYGFTSTEFTSKEEKEKLLKDRQQRVGLSHEKVQKAGGKTPFPKHDLQDLH